MKITLLGLVLLASMAFASGTVSTESFEVNVTNPYIEKTESTESFEVNVTNPYTQKSSSTESFETNVTSMGIDYPLILDLVLSPDPVNFMTQSLSISADLTTVYSQDIASVTAKITGCGNGLVDMSLQSGTCSDSCIYAGSFTPTQDGVCLVMVNATDSQGSSGYEQASATAIGMSYTFTGTTGQSTSERGIALVNITSMPSDKTTLIISAASTTKRHSIETSASSLKVSVLITMGSAPAPNKEVVIEVS